MKLMKTPLHILNIHPLLAAGIVLGGCTGFTIVAAETPPQDTSAVLLRLQKQLDQQTERIDRLYRALGPQLEELEVRAAEFEKQQQEDKALAMERIGEVQDENLTAIGCANPAAPEFAVITGEGGVRIFDAGGKPVKELEQSGQAITCLAFSPSGLELLTGTESGALLVWDVAKGTALTLGTNVGRQVDRVTWLGHDRVVWGSGVEYWKEGKAATEGDRAQETRCHRRRGAPGPSGARRRGGRLPGLPPGRGAVGVAGVEGAGVVKSPAEPPVCLCG